MKEVIVSSLAEPVGILWKELQEKYTQTKTFTVASPLSGTSIPIYQWIIEHASGFPHWKKTQFLLMDEMVEKNNALWSYIPLTDPASYEGFARNHLIYPLKEKIGIDIPVIKPYLTKLEEFSIEIDLLILALGVKGNYANVMPGTTVETGWHIARLSSEFRQAHTKQGSSSYEGATFREYGMSLGPQQVLKAKHVVVIISGEKKRDLTRELKDYDACNPAFPLSIIYHPEIEERVTIYITQDAA